MLKNTNRIIILVLLCLTFLCDVCLAEQTRISDLKQGEKSTVKVRIGERVENEEEPGLYVFTARDDFGKIVHGRTRKNIDDIRFGSTYRIEGQLSDESSPTGRPYFDVDSWKPAYGFPILYVIIPVAAATIIGIIIALVLSKRIKPVEPAQAWDYAEIVSGPDQGQIFPLKGDKVVVGRKQDPETSICVVLDGHVSRLHGELIREGDKTYYMDTESKCGSWVEEQQVESGQKVVVPPGAYLRVGPHTVIRVGKAPEGDLANETREYGVDETGAWAEAPTRADTGTDKD